MAPRSPAFCSHPPTPRLSLFYKLGWCLTQTASSRILRTVLRARCDCMWRPQTTVRNVRLVLDTDCQSQDATYIRSRPLNNRAQSPGFCTRYPTHSLCCSSARFRLALEQLQHQQSLGRARAAGRKESTQPPQPEAHLLYVADDCALRHVTNWQYVANVQRRLLPRIDELRQSTHAPSFRRSAWTKLANN